MKSKNKMLFIFTAVYSTWILLWVILATMDAGYGVSGFFYLTITGMPFSFFAWGILPSGGITSLFAVGVMGMSQWVLVLLFIFRFKGVKNV